MRSFVVGCDRQDLLVDSRSVAYLLVTCLRVSCRRKMVDEPDGEIVGLVVGIADMVGEVVEL